MDAEINDLQALCDAKDAELYKAECEIERLRLELAVEKGWVQQYHDSYGKYATDIAKQQIEIKRLLADLRICWNWGDPADMTIEDQEVWTRLHKKFGDE